ncbi:MAG: class I SAM-dependent methyltransferase [Planctomycetota bacterium]|jgi:hypothetical protein
MLDRTFGSSDAVRPVVKPIFANEVTAGDGHSMTASSDERKRDLPKKGESTEYLGTDAFAPDADLPSVPSATDKRTLRDGSMQSNRIGESRIVSGRDILMEADEAGGEQRLSSGEKAARDVSGQPGKANAKTGLLLARPIMTLMNKVEGWLEEDEADLLMASCHKVLADIPHTNSIVEIGSYCGRSTIVLGSVVKAVNPEAKVYAIDPHGGRVGALDNGIMKEEPTLERFRHNIAAAGLNENVEIVRKHSFEVAWNKEISLLLIDGLHDYVNVSRDFFHFEPWIIDRGYILFHDYADYYPGVKAFVNEILASGRFREILCVNSMIAVQKLHDAETHPGVRPLVQIHHK